MITCKECSKTNPGGSGETGTSWICEDCKVDAKEQAREREDGDSADVGGHG
ncbi:hypothetical protein I8J29_30475 [Paenibacillus sp. MWE-103]|uniref:Uncharacterized protein n=1 Tax=Paenibacillus artemisiicola TaxID=1172618 RepID=A0ABS3WJL3_9BACL|nr:hypothetical protein [Paenibacillus artemisiicola]MBO7748509.1 hypothetical protein [Paenibacillus artemisiicola]